MAKNQNSRGPTEVPASEKVVQLPLVCREAQVSPETFNADANTIEIVWTTGAAVRRCDWWDGTEYDEVLSLAPGAVRLDRMNLGAPFLDTHSSYGLDNVIGSVVPGSAKIEDNRGIATILLSKAAGVADTVQKIREGVIRNISVGYWQHKVVKSEADDSKVARWDVVDWEPLEVSAVPIPADPGSQIRSQGNSKNGEPEMRSCVLVTSGSAERQSTPSRRTSMAKKQTASATRGEATDETEKKRLAALRAAKRDDDNKDDESDDDRDDDVDEKMDGDETDSDKEKDTDDERDDDTSDTAEGDDEDKKDEDERATAASAKRAADLAIKQERQRIAEITDVARQAGLSKLGERHIGKGTSVRAFRDLVLQRMLEKQAKGAPAAVGVTGERTLDTKHAQVRGSEQRQMAEGEEHWRRVAGKPPKAA
jgi:hypothetical protein